MRSTYTVEFTPAGLAYVRQVLGTRPYDEAGPLIGELERQKAEQDKEAAAPSVALVATPEQLNGSSEPAAPH